MGASALKAFGEWLLRQAENSPRLQRALEQGYDLSNPLVHGTAAKASFNKPRPMHFTEDPMLALEYTKAGGRRGGVGTPTDNPKMIPAVIRAPIQDSDLAYREFLSQQDPSWVRRLGVDDPQAFQDTARRHTVDMWRDLQNKGDYANYTIDNTGWGGLKYNRALSNSSILDNMELEAYRFFDMPGFRQALVDFDIPAVRYRHPRNNNTITDKGRMKYSPEEIESSGVFVADPALIRSPWAEFLKPGVGLMKKKGGLVQMKEHCGG